MQNLTFSTGNNRSFNTGCSFGTVPTSTNGTDNEISIVTLPNDGTLPPLITSFSLNVQNPSNAILLSGGINITATATAAAALQNPIINLAFYSTNGTTETLATTSSIPITSPILAANGDVHTIYVPFSHIYVPQTSSSMCSSFSSTTINYKVRIYLTSTTAITNLDLDVKESQYYSFTAMELTSN